ncbi:MAG: winged helix-turn-helix domain-containing protein [Crocinitomicaceae bacterium]|nr:winged helix-turn-helix domain-containing protein [Crocinitomicaceae bacterium]
MIRVKLFRSLFLLLLFLWTADLHAATQDQQIKVALRKIGHEFLLELNDSTSRVLPIEKIDGRYALRFERPFSFMPDVLNFITWKVLSDAKINANYIVEVERCGTNQVVHSFNVNPAANDTSVACQGRTFPEDCYEFYYTVNDTTAFNSAENNSPSSSDITEKKSSGFYFLLLILPIGIVVYLVLKPKKKNQTKTNSDLIQIGQFQFDQKKMILHHHKTESAELSGKESELLLLLYSNENKTLEREFILKQVWQDSGEYVGRTLDVFISKLRKKLEADPNLKIINIRGVGYKFVISEG